MAVCASSLWFCFCCVLKRRLLRLLEQFIVKLHYVNKRALEIRESYRCGIVTHSPRTFRGITDEEEHLSTERIIAYGRCIVRVCWYEDGQPAAPLHSSWSSWSSPPASTSLSLSSSLDSFFFFCTFAFLPPFFFPLPTGRPRFLPLLAFSMVFVASNLGN